MRPSDYERLVPPADSAPAVSPAPPPSAAAGDAAAAAAATPTAYSSTRCRRRRGYRAGGGGRGRRRRHRRSRRSAAAAAAAAHDGLQLGAGGTAAAPVPASEFAAASVAFSQRLLASTGWQPLTAGGRRSAAVDASRLRYPAVPPAAPPPLPAAPPPLVWPPPPPAAAGGLAAPPAHGSRGYDDGVRALPPLLGR